MDSNAVNAMEPIFKWAGGKRWLVKSYSDLFPSNFKRYIEPFLGSGAVFFKLNPRNALLSDTNAELINAYQAVQKRPDLVLRYLKFHNKHHSSEHYYSIRSKIPTSVFSRAARTIYLNRTCWNALYRVNLDGKFNVPIGTKDDVILRTDNFYGASKVLNRAHIQVSDFEPVIADSKKGDFIFIDPPYTVKHNVNGFVKYNENIFSWEDQIRLRKAIELAATSGAKIMVTNADHESIRELYSDLNLISLNRHSVIAGDSKARGRYSELLIRNW